MSRKSYIDPAIKIRLVKLYLKGEISKRTIEIESGIADRSGTVVTKWINIYKNAGPSGLMNQKRNKSYPVLMKTDGVRDYLNGKGSVRTIAANYGLRSETQFLNWIKEYNTHGEIRSRGSGGGSYMRKARQTSIEERIEIVKDCLSNNRNYGASALKYGYSYQQVRNWVLRYEKMGPTGLEDRRGRRTGTLPSRTPEEELRDRIAELEQKNEDLQMENDILKKVKELEMRNRCR